MSARGGSETHEDRRVVIHFDLDAFYVACERELNEALRGVPVGVSQYNPYGRLEEKAAHEVDRRLVVRPGHAPEHNEDSNGSLIAVSYEARAAGVRRNDRGLMAVSKCPELRIVQVPLKHGKADLTMYRSASARVMDVLARSLREEAAKFTSSDGILVEIASIDEVYVDITKPAHEMADCVCNDLTNEKDNATWREFVGEASQCTTIGGLEILSGAAEATNALNKNDLRRGSHLQVLDSSKQTVDDGSRAWWDRELSKWTNVEIRLACGAFLASKARCAVLKAFEGGVFTLSAGISNNKTLAKLASGLKKPHRQTLINRTDTNGALEKLFHPLPLGRIRGLGGKFGEEVSTKLNISTVGQLAEVPLTTLLSTLPGDTSMAHFLYDIARGICRDEVTERTKVKSIACGKTFRGKLAISSTDISTCRKWTRELCCDLTERISVDKQQNNRFPTLLVVSVKTNEQRSSASKSCRAPRKLDAYGEAALQLVLQLVDAAKARVQAASSADPALASVSISITGMSVSATSFVDMAAGSSSIVAAFKRSSNSAMEAVDTDNGQMTRELDATMVTKENANSLNSPRVSSNDPSINRLRGTNNNSIDKWLSQKGTNQHGSHKSSPTVTGSNKQQGKAGSMHRFLGGPSSSSTKKGTNTREKRPSTVALPTMEEIDPSVLNEIPEDLRISLLEDLACQRKSKKKRGTITSFLNREAHS